MKSLKFSLLLGACITAACSKSETSYESHFSDTIDIEFPSGHPESEVEPMKKHIDEKLRASKTGFFSGVMVGGTDIGFISIDTDFKLVDETRPCGGIRPGRNNT